MQSLIKGTPNTLMSSLNSYNWQYFFSSKLIPLSAFWIQKFVTFLVHDITSKQYSGAWKTPKIGFPLWTSIQGVLWYAKIFCTIQRIWEVPLVLPPGPSKLISGIIQLRCLCSVWRETNFPRCPGFLD